MSPSLNLCAIREAQLWLLLYVGRWQDFHWLIAQPLPPTGTVCGYPFLMVQWVLGRVRDRIGPRTRSGCPRGAKGSV